MLARQGASPRCQQQVTDHVARVANTAVNGAKRTAAGAVAAETLTAKLGQPGRDKERKDKEDVELKPPWGLLPYSRDPASGILCKRPLLTAGYPDFYPSKGTEPEYVLSERAISDGFQNKPVVAV